LVRFFISSDVMRRLVARTTPRQMRR